MSKEHIQPYPQLGVAVTCRSFDEYVKMFNLTKELLRSGPILDIAGGASSFTADANRQGYAAFAVDPQYDQKADQLTKVAEQEIATSTSKLEKHQSQYDWSFYGSLANHRKQREQSLSRFAEHYRAEQNKLDSAYVAGAFPQLPLADNYYSLVLCSHFLFLYQEQFDTDFHLGAIREMYRICRPGGQIRLYPLLTLKYELYPELDTILDSFREAGVKVTFEQTGLPFIPGSSELLVLSKPKQH